MGGRALALGFWHGATVTKDKRGRRAIHLSYMKLMDLQKLDKAAELLGSQHCHRAAVALQVATSLKPNHQQIWFESR